jgi:hypothetical protein
MNLMPENRKITLTRPFKTTKNVKLNGFLKRN